MEWLKVLALGIIQGITEWLPVSSTGHMLLFDALFPLQMGEDAKNLFLVLIQLGSILAVIVLYWHTLNPFSKTKGQRERKETWSLWLRVLVASIPVAVVGLFVDDWVDVHLHTWQTISVALFAYGLLYVLLERKRKGTSPRIRTMEDVSYRDALLVGCFQMLAIVPGTSRSGSTILGAIILGFDRGLASRFSFFMAIPAMVGASLLKVVKLGFHLSGEEWMMVLFGSVAAFLVSLWALHALVNYVRRHDFSVFGWYRMVLAVVVALYFSLR